MNIKNLNVYIILGILLLQTPCFASGKSEHQRNWNVLTNALLKPGTIYTGIEILRNWFEYRNLPMQTRAERTARAQFLRLALAKSALIGFTAAFANYVNLGAEFWVPVDGQTQLARFDEERRHRLIEAFGDAGSESVMAFKEGNHDRPALIVAKHLWQLTHAFTLLGSMHPDLKLVRRAFQVPWKAELGVQELTFSADFVANIWEKLGMYVQNERGSDPLWKRPYEEMVAELFAIKA